MIKHKHSFFTIFLLFAILFYSIAEAGKPVTSDKKAPSVSITSPSNNTTYTSAQMVTINASASDNVGVTKVEFYDGTALKGTDTSSPYSYSWSFTSVNNGTHSWTAKAYDAANNSTVSSIVTLTVNIATPLPTVITGSASTITATTATLNGTVNPNGASTNAYFQYGTTTGYGSSTSSQAMGSGTAAVSIPGGNISGLTCNTTYHYRALGTNSGGPSYGSDVTFKTSACTVTPPTGTININNSAAYTNTQSVTLALSCTPYNGGTCTQMQFSNDNVTWSALVTYAATKVWDLTSGDGTKTVYAKFKDNAGNWSIVYSDTISLDTVPPQCSVVINNSATYTSTAAVTLSLSAVDPNPGSGLSQMCVNYTNASCSSWVNYATTMNWTLLPAGDGTKYVYAWFKDNAGNITATPSITSDSIILDTTAPTNGTLSATAGNAQVGLSWSGFSDATTGIGSYKLVYSTGSTPTSCASGTQIYSGTGMSYIHTGLTNGTTYYYRVCATDNAQNTSSGAIANAKPTVPPLPTVTTGSATNIFSTSAVLHGTVNPNGLGTTTYFQYGTTTSYGTNTASQSMGSGTSTVEFTQAISGLTCGTPYHYRAVGTSSGGSTYGVDRTFTPVTISPSITSPASGTTYTTEQTVTITASASASCGTISKVEFLDNGNVVATDTTYPFSYPWAITSANNGTHSWVARAYDAIGQNTTSLPVSLTVQIVPPPGAFQWSRNFSNTSNAYGQSVAIDSRTGNVIIAGYFTGTVDFGNGPVTSSGSYDIYVAAYSSSGTYQWAKRFGNSFPNYAYSVAVDGNSNVFVTGAFQGTVDFGKGPLTSTGGYDIFVAKFSSSGATSWTKRLGSSIDDYGYGIAVDGTGDVLCTGFFQGTVDFGSGIPLTSSGMDTFVAKFSGNDGSYRWAGNFLSNSSDVGYSIATDSSGDVFVTGAFMSAIRFGSSTLYSAGGYDIFLLKLTGTNGTYMWAKRLGGTSNDLSYSVAVDSSNNVVITGNFVGTVDFGGGPISCANGSGEVFLAKYSGLNGSHLWSRGFSSSSSSAGYGIAVDKYTNDIVVTGTAVGTVDFGGGPVTIASPSMFMAKYSYAGTYLMSYLWSKRFGAVTYNAAGEGVAIDGGGNAIVTGQFQGTVDFGGGPQASANGASYIYDIFLVKFGQ